MCLCRFHNRVCIKNKCQWFCINSIGAFWFVVLKQDCFYTAMTARLINVAVQHFWYAIPLFTIVRTHRRAALFMPIRFMPTDSCPPIHAHFFHARSYSCLTLFMPTRTYSCRNLFMPKLIHAMKIQKQIPMDYSCQDMAKTYSCPNWFMPQRAFSCLDFSCPCLFMPVLH